MRKFGLIGYPLGHSFSQAYFARKFASEGLNDCEYTNYPLESIEEFRSLLDSNQELRGLNVTIPWKEKVVPFLDELDPVAADVGAVNCIRIGRSCKGFNTDVYGFEMSVKPFLEGHHERALVLGAGGAAKAVIYALRKIGIQSTCVSRNPDTAAILRYEELREVMPYYHLIINTTPVGQYPEMHSFPNIPYDLLTPRHLVYDLVYNPEETMFLKKAAERGALVLGGGSMLKLQADRSWEIWNEKD